MLKSPVDAESRTIVVSSSRLFKVGNMGPMIYYPPVSILWIFTGGYAMFDPYQDHYSICDEILVGLQ
jgi:hypothetical protein